MKYIILGLSILALLAFSACTPLSPNKFIPDSCTASAPINCEDFIVEGNTLTLSLGNQINEPLQGVKISSDNCPEVDVGTIEPGNPQTVVINCIEDIERENLEVTYYRSDPAFTNVAQIEIVHK